MALFGAIYGLIAWYAAVVEHNWLAFALVTVLAYLAFGSSVAGLRAWRRQKAREEAAELKRRAKAEHPHEAPHHSHRHQH